MMSWEHLPSFEPSKFFPNGHLQTVFSHLLNVPAMTGEYERWTVKLEDGDEIWCRFYSGRTKEFAVLFHGLGGSADSSYMQVCGAALRSAGHSVLLVNHRGSGEGAGHAAGIYHSGAVSDIAAVLRYARSRRPELRITAVGYSLSANLLLNAGALLSQDLPDRIVAVNPPIDLHITSRLLDRPTNFIYDQKFVFDLKAMMHEKHKRGEIQQRPDFPRLCRLKDFDELITAPFAGFRSRDEYYTQCSSFHHAGRIRPETLILTAADDPFIPPEPFHRAKFGSHVFLKIEKFGGHVGYMGRRGRWLGEFIQAAFA